MVRRTKLSRRSRGFTLVDTLFGAAIVTTAILGFVAICGTLFRMTDNHRSNTVCYMLARQNVEAVRAQGFQYAAEGTTYKWYDESGQNETTSAGTSSAYEVDVNIVSSSTTLSAGKTLPTDDALRTVTVTVKAYPAGNTLLTWGTLLTKGGI